MRLFVSVDLPDDLAGTVEGIQDELRGASGLSFINPNQAHVTLKFLGETPHHRLSTIESAVAAAVDEADVDTFEASLGELGAFPSESYIRVVWLGFETGGEALTRLHEAIEARTVDLGFEAESHDFTPHITLARMEHAGGKELVQRVLREHDGAEGRMTVEAVQLTESRLGPDGPEYTALARYPL